MVLCNKLTKKALRDLGVFLKKKNDNTVMLISQMNVSVKLFLDFWGGFIHEQYTGSRTVKIPANLKTGYFCFCSMLNPMISLCGIVDQGGDEWAFWMIL